MQTDRYSQVDQSTKTIDAGLQKHFQGVYNIMALGLAVTGATAYGVSLIPGVEHVYGFIQSNIFIAMAILAGPMMLMTALFNPIRMQNASFQSLILGFVGFSMFWGALFGSIFLVYSVASIVKTFLITAATFAAMSIWGYTSKRDLSKMGSLLGMATIGVFFAIFINVILQSPMMHMAISAIGILIYTGLTAWDTQKIKAMYHHSYGHTVNAKLSVMGALSLYINFIMLFQFLLNFMGSRD